MLHLLRTPRPAGALALSLTLALSLPAQTTWVVDANSGPGTQFTDIQPAVDAAADGDRILVRRGFYTGFQIVGKGLAVLATGDARITGTGAVHVANTTAQQDVVLTGLIVDSEPPVFSNHGATNCRGRVLWEGGLFENNSRGATFRDCADLRIARTLTFRGIQIVDSRAFLTDSAMSGGRLLQFAPPALRLTNSVVDVSRSSLTGQSQFVRASPSSAVSLDATSVLTLSSAGQSTIAAGASQAGPLPGIAGNGTVLRDPRYQIRGSAGGPPLAAGITDVVRSIPSLQVLQSLSQNTVELDLSGLPGQPYAVLFGLPAAPFQLPGIGGTIGIDAPLASFFGVFGAGSVQRSYGIGPGLPPGFQLCWQAVARDLRGAWHVSVPATYARIR